MDAVILTKKSNVINNTFNRKSAADMMECAAMRGLLECVANSIVSFQKYICFRTLGSCDMCELEQSCSTSSYRTGTILRLLVRIKRCRVRV